MFLNCFLTFCFDLVSLLFILINPYSFLNSNIFVIKPGMRPARAWFLGIAFQGRNQDFQKGGSKILVADLRHED